MESVNAVLKGELEALKSQHMGTVTESNKREEILKQQVNYREVKSDFICWLSFTKILSFICLTHETVFKTYFRFRYRSKLSSITTAQNKGEQKKRD